MEKFKGKPGPWHWEGKVLCNDANIVGGDGWTFNDADKKLIAAAPDLLEALRFIINDCSRMIPKCAEDKAIAAIKKALGEKQ